MKQNYPKFHIDVTPEEDSLFREPIKQKSKNEKQNIMNIKVIGAVVGFHVLGVAALFAASPTNNKEEFKQTPPVLPVSSPVPSPSPVLTTSYVVKKGDTFTSIVKRFKLNSNKLIELNNIKDPNKLSIGQTLKFVK